jgi:hypothetical protein
MLLIHVVFVIEICDIFVIACGLLNKAQLQTQINWVLYYCVPYYSVPGHWFIPP